jgi:hypothetical protein
MKTAGEAETLDIQDLWMLAKKASKVFFHRKLRYWRGVQVKC